MPSTLLSNEGTGVTPASPTTEASHSSQTHIQSLNGYLRLQKHVPGIVLGQRQKNKIHTFNP